MKRFKKLVLSLLALVLITITILWGLAKSGQSDFIKTYVNSQLTSLVSQPSQINGDISWYIFPRPGIRITAVSVGEFDSQSPLAIKIDNLMFNLKITPLLRGRLVFSDLQVDGFNVQLKSDTPALPKQAVDNKVSATISSAKEFAIESLLLSKGTIAWINHEDKLILTGVQIGAEQVNLEQQAFPFQLKGKFQFSKAEQAQAKAQINFKGSTKLSPAVFLSPQTALQSLFIFGQLSLLDIQINTLKFDHLSANTHLKEGKLQLNPLTLSLYKGESVGDLTYDMAQHSLSINQTASNVDSNKLTQALFARNFLHGSMDFSLHTQSNLQNQNWQSNTKGSGSLTVKDGALQIINFNKIIDDINQKMTARLENRKNGIKEDSAPDGFNQTSFYQGTTAFKLLTMEYRFENGLLPANLLVLQTDKLQLKGQGVYNFNDNSINARLQAKLTIANDTMEKIQQLLGGSIPVSIRGNINDPEISPDLTALNKTLPPLRAVRQRMKNLGNEP